MSILDTMMAAREARDHSPAFQAEIARENAEFMNILGDLGNNTLDAGVGIVLKTPTALFLNAMKTLYKKDYKFGNYTQGAFKLFFGKEGVAHKTFRVAANAVHLVGQGAKIGVRQLFKV